MKIHIDAAFKSVNKNNEELCGDKVQILRTENSTIAVLADGLGSGVKANILSTLSSTIVSTMLHEGSTIAEVVGNHRKDTAGVAWCAKVGVLNFQRFADF